MVYGKLWTTLRTPYRWQTASRKRAPGRRSGTAATAHWPSALQSPNPSTREARSGELATRHTSNGTPLAAATADRIRATLRSAPNAVVREGRDRHLPLLPARYGRPNTPSSTPSRACRPPSSTPTPVPATAPTPTPHSPPTADLPKPIKARGHRRQNPLRDASGTLPAEPASSS